MTTYALRSGKLVIGRSELEDEHRERGERRGAFRPGFGWQLVEPVFDLLAEAQPDERGPVVDAEKLVRYQRARDALQLRVVDQLTGTEHPADSIDVRQASGDALALVVRFAPPLTGSGSAE